MGCGRAEVCAELAALRSTSPGRMLRKQRVLRDVELAVFYGVQTECQRRERPPVTVSRVVSLPMDYSCA